MYNFDMSVYHRLNFPAQQRCCEVSPARVLMSVFLAATLFMFFIPRTVVRAQDEAPSEERYDVDSGFRPVQDGFNFPNYGISGCRDAFCIRTFPVTNLTTTEMVRLFGRDVCSNAENVVNGEPCALSNVAASWMKNVNRELNNGHCEGLSILAARFFNGSLSPEQFGAERVSELILSGNPRFQREIAYWYATQLLTETEVIEETPVSLLRSLILAFREDPNQIIQLGIYRRDLQVGHTVSAYAIREMGDGIFRVMVYDSNFPQIERFITINAKTNSWQYFGNALPTREASVYSGEGEYNPIGRILLTEKTEGFHCDFCPAGRRDGDNASTIKLVTNGNVNIFVADETGKKSGRDWKSGQLYNELSGVTFRRIAGTNSTVFPSDQRYYFWLNAPAASEWKRFKVTMTSAGSILTLKNVMESYEYPTMTYRPAALDEDVYFESYDVLFSPVAPPEIELIVSGSENAKDGEMKVKFAVERIGEAPETANLNIFILHFQELGIVGIETYAANDEDLARLRDVKLRFNGMIEVFGADRNLSVETGTLERPLEVGLNGAVYFDYGSWLENGTLPVSIEPDGMTDELVMFEIGDSP